VVSAHCPQVRAPQLRDGARCVVYRDAESSVAMTDALGLSGRPVCWRQDTVTQTPVYVPGPLARVPTFRPDRPSRWTAGRDNHAVSRQGFEVSAISQPG